MELRLLVLTYNGTIMNKLNKLCSTFRKLVVIASSDGKF